MIKIIIDLKNVIYVFIFKKFYQFQGHVGGSVKHG